MNFAHISILISANFPFTCTYQCTSASISAIHTLSIEMVALTGKCNFRVTLIVLEHCLKTYQKLHCSGMMNEISVNKLLPWIKKTNVQLFSTWLFRLLNELKSMEELIAPCRSIQSRELEEWRVVTRDWRTHIGPSSSTSSLNIVATKLQKSKSWNLDWNDTRAVALAFLPPINIDHRLEFSVSSMEIGVRPNDILNISG